MQEGLLESSPSCVFAKSARLLDPYAHAGHCAVRTVKRSRNHGVDFFALLDHHNLQVYKPTGARIDMRCSGAIAVDVVGATAGGPLHRGRKAIGDDVVHLGRFGGAPERGEKEEMVIQVV